ncbi:hypothetical protein GGI12_001484 [Dipsacomyces acuminosporus]|nr:hypothetical protein GGI12_001484 [Dipsacomyces acuminosporus]
MSGAGGNSTHIVFDNGGDANAGVPLPSIAFSLSALSLVLVCLKVVYERWMTPLSKVPGPLLHSVTSIPMRYHMVHGTLPEFLLDLHRRYGAVVRISPQRVSVADVDVIKRVLSTHTFAKTPSYDMPPVLEPNAFSTRSAEVSVARRRQIGPGFSHKHLSTMEEKIIECTVAAVGQKLDKMLGCDGSATGAWFSLIALDTIGVLAFGKQFRSLENESHELIPLLSKVRVFNYMTMAFPWLKKVPKLLGRRLTVLTKVMDFGQQAIDQRRSEIPAASAKAAPDILQFMLNAGKVDGDKCEPMSDAQIVSENVVQLLAGVDTTTSGLTWTLMLLLHNPHIYQRLVAEIRSEFPAANGGDITFADCRARLPYLGAVISESLRIMSPAPGMLPRLAPAGGVRLAGYYLPAGTWICCAIGSVHMNPSVFPDPTAFDPGRFMGDDGRERHTSMLAFSTGVRACIGKNLALVEMHLVLANLLRNYDLYLPSATLKQGVSEKNSGAGAVPAIPRRTHMTMNPTRPDRDCLVVVAKAPASI